ncbi:hypothetical protein F511_29206 [Dorcoceras hygrometricum]|uniref:Uncharacterized protein n=1 Tax=Dorcoceras hygrometricum TaxID=472368 RepID=A0A2Z7BLB6_9LAMI|nr:hypothetical protein F511_29206 [Dorcoceras hygrometricum]
MASCIPKPLRVTQVLVSQFRRRPKLNQLERRESAENEDQLQALKSKVNQLVQEYRSALKIQFEMMKISWKRKSGSNYKSAGALRLDDISSDVIIQQELQCSADEVSVVEDSADERSACYGMSCDDISLDVIIISRWISAEEAKHEKLKRRRVKFQQMA